jgi:hypothetical protein
MCGGWDIGLNLSKSKLDRWNRISNGKFEIWSLWVKFCFAIESSYLYKSDKTPTPGCLPKVSHQCDFMGHGWVNLFSSSSFFFFKKNNNNNSKWLSCWCFQIRIIYNYLSKFERIQAWNPSDRISSWVAQFLFGQVDPINSLSQLHVWILSNSNK